MILGKIIKIVATRCHILKIKCIKFDFGWGLAPDPADRVYSAPPRPLAGFNQAYFYGERGKGKVRENGWEGKKERGREEQE